MNTISVRYARPRDFDYLKQMFLENARQLVKTFGYMQRMSEEQQEWLRRQLYTGRRFERVTLVAEVDGVLAGWIVAKKSNDKLSHYSPWWINVLFVAKKFRRRGIGSKLLHKALTELRKLFGARKVGLQTRAHNERAKRLYRRFGFYRQGIERRHNKRTRKMGTWFVMVKPS